MIVGAILLSCIYAMTIEQCIQSAEAYPSMEACQKAAAGRHGVLVKCYPVIGR